MVKVAARWLSFPRSRWRSNLTKDESTFGTGQKTDLLIDPANSRDDHQLAFAVGAPYCLLFGAAAIGLPDASFSAAIALAIGIGIQNFPEGFAVAMPMRRMGMSRLKSFWYGQLSAIVEPVAGVIGALAVIYMQPILPFALAFAAGAMIYVVVEEVIPETQRDKYTDVAVLGFIGGFLVMMILDVALG